MAVLSAVSRPRPSYWHSLWLLTKRDLKVRYSTSVLGYLWSILDPLLMSAIYWFVFAVVFQRGDGVGESPYIVFLLSALLPWTWFNGATSDATRAFLKEAKLIRSTKIPRTIWVTRLTLSKGIEFVASLPVLLAFALFTGATLHVEAFLIVIAIALQTVLTIGIGLIVAPLVVFFRDLERAVKLLLRFAFYASPIVYSTRDLPERLQWVAGFNPLSGIFSIYRSMWFPQELNWYLIGMSAVISTALLFIGLAVFRRTLPAVLKEI